MTNAHWHVATGFAGYGPDGSDGYLSADDVHGTAELIRSELNDEIDGLGDTAEGFAQSEDFESAWKSRKLADELETFRMNVDSARASAPLYRDSPDAWVETLTRLIGEKFPMDLDINGHRRLYVWQCTDSECEHLGDDD
jgi:hypothetical protein